MRNFVENYHENWKCSRQIYWSNQPVENTKDYFYVILVIPFNDQVCVEYRFPGNELTQYRGLYTISYVMLNKSSGWEKEFMIFANHYYENFPDFDNFDVDPDLWYKLWDCARLKSNLPDYISVTPKRVDLLPFLKIRLTLKLLDSLSITTFELKRSFSSLGVVKSWDLSTMKNAMLNRLPFLFIHR